MRIFQINGAVFGSTGKIMFGIASEAERLGHSVMCAAPVTKTNRYREPEHDYVKIGTYYGRCCSVLLSRLTGFEGCFAVFATLKLLRRVEKFQPDVIHLHNIHGSYINLPLLFRFIKKSGVRVVWTLHDCWAFTGHCANFDMIGCEQWKSECKDCPQYREYPKAYVNNAGYMHRLKKRWFLGIEDMTIVTPSKWLAGLVKESFLRDYPVDVIRNGINLSVFKPTPGDFRHRYHCEKKCMILGVAFGWSMRKGLDVFISLAQQLDEHYQIVLVGTDENIDRQLPPNIISIHRTENQWRLAEIYTAADVFLNPTREDNYPTVNLEALACGTPVVTFNSGGSPECVDEACGAVVEKDDRAKMMEIIERIVKENRVSREEIRKKARSFDEKERCKEVVKYYEG